MRLTLRTLLAYLDDILEPKQTKELGEKIADSHFATSLINRIREVLRRRRLTAPTLHGPGSGLDPNTVAEYLDNTLPPEKVADVEKTCLESDVHLAEMAGCHQILTLVLGEPVEIVPESRERIYALTAPDRFVSLPNTTEEQPQAAVRAAAAPAPTPEPEPMPLPPTVVEENEFRKGIPDYLRKPPLWKRMLPYGAAAVAIFLVAYMLFSPKPAAESQMAGDAMDKTAQSSDDEKVVAALPPKQSEPDVDAAPAVAAADDVAEPAIEDTEPAVAEEPAEVTVAQSDDVESVFDELPLDPPAPPDGEVGLPLEDPVELEDVITDVAPLDEGLFPPEPAITSEPDTEPAVVPTEPVDTDPVGAEPADVELPEAATTETDPTPGPTLATAESVDTAGGKVVPPVQPAEAAPAVPQPFQPPASAQYQWFGGLTQGQWGVVLIKDPNEDGWRKLAPRSMIHPGDMIVVPDPYFASLRLSEGNTHLTMLPGSQNGTAIGLTDATEAGNCTIRVGRGRLVFRGKSDGKSQDGGPVNIGLRVADELWQVKFLTPDAVWGLEVIPRQPEGQERYDAKTSYTASLYVTHGTIQFSDGDRLDVTKEGPSWIPLTPGQRPTINPDGTVQEADPLTTVPSWMGQAKPTRKQLEDSRRFTREFDEIQPIEISLVGAIDHRDADIAALAVKCFALTGDYEQLIKTLARSEHREVRRAATDGVRDWLPTDPESGEKLRAALAFEYHEENADIVYQLLWGIPKEDAQKLEPSLRLVQWLGHEDLAIRELAFDEVRRLTDKQGTLGYHPQHTAAQRNRAISNWEKSVNRDNGLHK